MKLLIKIIIFSTIIFTSIFSQNETSKVQGNDPTRTFKTDALLNLSYKFDEFDFYRNLTKPIFNLNVDSSTAKLALRTSVEMSNNSSLDNENPTPMYLHSILYEEYLEKSKFNPVRTALGLIQAGAVGYLAYRHIKKWGFIK
jgi:hypothetical protein